MTSRVYCYVDRQIDRNYLYKEILEADEASALNRSFLSMVTKEFIPYQLFADAASIIQSAPFELSQKQIVENLLSVNNELTLDQMSFRSNCDGNYFKSKYGKVKRMHERGNSYLISVGTAILFSKFLTEKEQGIFSDMFDVFGLNNEYHRLMQFTNRNILWTLKT